MKLTQLIAYFVAIYVIVLVLHTVVLTLMNALFTLDKKWNTIHVRWTCKKILIITAHPDDESMFFMPSILSMVQQKIDVHLICFSNGNADGLGKIRQKELLQACRHLQIPSQNITIVDHDSLQDGMHNVWDATVLVQTLSHYLDKNAIDTVLTFDIGGVSGHSNHRALYHSMVALKKQQQKLTCYTLLTHSICRKYIGSLEVWFPIDPNTTTCYSLNPMQSYRAMALHASQFVWYRRLFILFSSYGFVNTIEKC